MVARLADRAEAMATESFTGDGGIKVDAGGHHTTWLAAVDHGSTIWFALFSSQADSGSAGVDPKSTVGNLA